MLPYRQQRLFALLKVNNKILKTDVCIDVHFIPLVHRNFSPYEDNEIFAKDDYFFYLFEDFSKPI